VPKQKKQVDQTTQLKELVELRRRIAEHRPKFIRPESWRYVRIKPMWRKPKGLDHKVRKSFKGWPSLVSIGYRGPKVARSIHPSGHLEVLVNNVKEVEVLVPGRDAARIAAGVGARKRKDILARAKELGIVVLNPRGLRVIEPKK
jgi:large subunit ribosomal protein L32e